MTGPAGHDAEEKEVDRLAEEFVARVRRGEAPSADRYAEAHPELADRIRRLFPMLALMEGVRGTDTGAGRISRPTEAETRIPPRIGEYAIIREIGRGGMGRVFEARRGDERVAIKVVHAHLLADPRYVARFLREAEAGIRIDHPHVVRTIEAGVAEERELDAPYLVLELVDGQNLRTILRDVGMLPERLCLHIGRCVGEALAAFHTAGIVHRDIKPENVVITADETVKVMDMGVALLQEEAFRLSRSGDFVGSPLYAAPEQLLGGEVDGRTDLYALGLLLYEVATGRHPHRAGGEGRGAPPPPPSTLNPSISAFFDSVVLTLLGPRPEDRFESALALGRTLTEAELSPWWRARVSASATQPSALRLGRVPRATAFHGREAERHALDEAWEDARRGVGRVVLVEGEAGIGKSRLLHEWVAALPADGASRTPRVIAAQHAPGEDLLPALPLSAAVREALDDDALESELARLLGSQPWLIEVLTHHLRGQPPPDGVDAAVATASLVKLLHAMAREAPVVVVVEDLHFAGETSRALFLRLAAEARDAALLLVGTTRPSRTDDPLAGIASLPHASRLPLAGLAGPACRALFREALDRDAGLLGETAVVLGKSDGNPFFLLELAREWTRKRQEAAADPSRAHETSSTLEIPSSVRGFLRDRLTALTDAQRELLASAACVGYEFDPVLVAKAAGVGLVPALQEFGRLERTHGLLRAAGPHYRFQHHLVQETLRDETHPALREAYHSAIGAAMLAHVEADGHRPGDLDGPRVVALCTHLLGGRSPRAASPYLLHAQEYLVGQMEYTRATTLLERALERGGVQDGEQHVDVLHRLASGLWVAGRGGEAREKLLEAIRLSDAGGHARHGMLAREVLARQLHQIGENEESAQHAEAAVATAEALDLPKRAAVALAEQAWALGQSRRPKEARTACERGLALLDGEEGTDAERGLLRALAFIDAQEGDLDGASTHLERSLEITRARGSRGNESIALKDLAQLATRRGHYAEGLDRARSALDLARELEMQHVQSSLALGIALCALEVGRFDEADAWAREAADAARQQDRGDQRRFARLLQCRVRTARGEWREASQGLRELVDTEAQVTDRERDLQPASYWMELEALLGHADRATGFGRTMLGIARARRDGLRVSYLLDAQARIAEIEGRVADARALYEEAVAAGERSGSHRGERLLGLGRVRLGLGETKAGRVALEDAVAWGRTSGVVRLGILARAYLAGLEGGDVLAARVELESHASAIPVADRMEAHFVLWEAAGTAEDLEIAQGLLARLREQAPVADRGTMVDNVDLHRRIAEAR